MTLLKGLLLIGVGILGVIYMVIWTGIVLGSYGVWKIGRSVGLWRVPHTLPAFDQSDPRVNRYGVRS